MDVRIRYTKCLRSCMCLLQSPNTEPINFLLFHRQNSFMIFVMMKTRQPQIRKSSRPSWTLTLSLLVTCCFLVLILLTLCILSASNANSSTALSKPNHLSFIARTFHVSEEDDIFLDCRFIEEKREVMVSRTCKRDSEKNKKS